MRLFYQICLPACLCPPACLPACLSVCLPPPPPSPCAARRLRLYEQMRAVPATAGHSFDVGCLHPVLDGGQEPLEAKVREGPHTLV